jgi:8-oxo-dGTP pyrophosphatase MutT (NUDIX family)
LFSNIKKVTDSIMELNHQAITTPVRDAATVVLLRDAEAGLEVFLIKRSGLSDVLGGAYVFPGGKLDAADAIDDMPNRLDQSPQALHAALNEPSLQHHNAAALYVAALREAFEESGVLFAEGASLAVTAQAAKLLKDGHSFPTILAQLDLRLQTQHVQPWSRWITPKLASVSTKRFDTRFFLAAVPNHQTAAHDNYEATESVWLSPRAALEEYWSGGIALAPPQIMSLAHLSHHHSVASALAEARSKPPAVIEPEPFDYEGLRTITYPGDPQHSVSQRALPGPTRLRYSNKRFEPINGFEALFLLE